MAIAPRARTSDGDADGDRAGTVEAELDRIETGQGAVKNGPAVGGDEEITPPVLEDRDQELITLRRDSVQLKKDREVIRGRVEKMLEQIESIAEAS